ncbi:MAG: hypothetical protein AB7F28_01700 [Candidatus Margulisiibacteriota bacterium]
MTPISKHLAVMALILALTVCTGCARVASSKDVVLRMRVTLTLRGTPQPSLYRYYLVFNRKDATQLSDPILMPDAQTHPYFPTPGFPFNVGNLEVASHQTPSDNIGINYYYRNFFSSWTDYAVLLGSTNTVQFFKSDALNFEATTTVNEQYSTVYPLQQDLTIVGNKIIITFPLDVMSNTKPKIYFTVATAKRSNDEPVGSQTGVLQDVLDQNYAIDAVARSRPGLKQDVQDTDLDAQADILSVEAEVF